MAGDSPIEWTDKTWNPQRGCTRVSPGCGGPGPHGGCYAELIAARFSDPGQAYHGLAVRTPKGGRWTGKVALAEHLLDQPLRWRKPSRIFVNSMSDLFHEKVPDEWVARIFGVSIAAVHLRHHILQILTKRSNRMRELLASEEFWEIANAEAEMHVIEAVDPLDRRSDDARATLDDYGPDNPAPGVWLGVSVEDQQRADERIPDLLATPAAVRFLSCEPLLGPVDLGRIAAERDPVIGTEYWDALDRDEACRSRDEGGCGGSIDWVIAGGESGPRARPMHPDWARSLRDQCAAAGVPFFFKQWGEWAPEHLSNHTSGVEAQYLNRDWRLSRVGKRKAGRLLDGAEHNAMPKVAA